MMLLMLTKALANDSSKVIRIVLGAFIASLLVPISLYFPDSIFTTVIGKFIYSVLIIFCTFKFMSIYRMVKLLLLFYFTTFAVGGGLIALHFIIQNPIRLTANGILTFDSGYGDPVSWLFIIVGFPLIWLFTKNRMDKHAVEKIRYDQLYPVTIQMKNKSFSTTGYIDSGNQLVDPLTKKPVIICDEHFMGQWFSDDEWRQLEEAHQHLDFEKIPFEWEKRIQFIPYQGVEGKSNFLLAVRPDKLTVHYNERKIVTTKVLMGVQFSTLTKDHSYHCLLQPQIIKLAYEYSA